MTNLEKLTKVFCETLNVQQEVLPTLKYQDVEKWDSIGHMTLIAVLEEEYDIMLDVEDINELKSFEQAKQILTKYSIDF